MSIPIDEIPINAPIVDNMIITKMNLVVVFISSDGSSGMESIGKSTIIFIQFVIV